MPSSGVAAPPISAPRRCCEASHALAEALAAAVISSADQTCVPRRGASPEHVCAGEAAKHVNGGDAAKQVYGGDVAKHVCGRDTAVFFLSLCGGDTAIFFLSLAFCGEGRVRARERARGVGVRAPQHGPWPLCYGRVAPGASSHRRSS